MTRPGPSRRALRAASGAICLALGAVTAGRPFASLALLVVTVSACLALLGVREVWSTPRSSTSVLVAACWFVLTAVVLLAPGAGFRVLVVGLGIWLLIEGALRVVRAWTGAAGSDRLPALLFGLSSMVMGLLALRWPDVTLVVAALVFGLRVLWLGVVLLRQSLRGERPARRRTDTPRAQGALAGLSLLTAVALAGTSHSLHAGAPTPDRFYTAPDAVPPEPGRLLRVEPFTRAVPPGSRGWRILYTTTRDEGVPAVASGLVVVPDQVPDADLPVLAWAHGTTGVAEGCAPSLLEDPFEAGAMPALDDVLEAGWALVATDYVGLGTTGPHPYLIGEGEARSVLDAVRAARQLDLVDLGSDTVVWGHSQGGHAALWTGILAPGYAPDAGVAAVAAMAPASDLPALVPHLDDATGGAILGSFVIAAYDAAYDDVRTRDLVRPAARIPVREMAERCLAERSVVVSLIQSLLFDQPIFATEPDRGLAGARLAENVPSGPIDVPILITQGEADSLITESSQAGYVEQRCRSGGDVDYRTYAGLGHLDLVDPGSPMVRDLLAWTRARFAGDPVTASCPG